MIRIQNDAIDFVTDFLFGEQTIRISAQAYLLKFYNVKPVSEIYLEDGIEHIEMLYKK